MSQSDTQYVDALTESLRDVFGSMLACDVEVAAATQHANRITPHDISAMIGLSGDVIGCVLVSLPTATALAAYKAFTGETIEPDNPDFFDAVGELANMIAGGAKSRLEGRSVNIGLPAVILGKAIHVSAPKGVPFTSIPCRSPLGEFCIEVALRPAGG
ncbi:MAG: chemotaxis protein CheX [Sedimentisphaerales bacterium]|nr:chemotaxis protein CheX [Sedimentisphaerales bacterium]